MVFIRCPFIFLIVIHILWFRSVNAGRLWEFKRHNINCVEMEISNYGVIGHREAGASGLWWPIGTGHTYLWGAGIWFGAVDSITKDTLVTSGFQSFGQLSEFAPNLHGLPPDDSMAIIYMYPSPWPAPISYFPMAPQEHVSHQDSWTCFNDCDSAYHIPGDTRPIGLEVYQTVYDWDLLDLEDMIFFIFECRNVAGHNLNDCYIGLNLEFAIGDNAGTANDIISGIVGQWFDIGSESLWVDNLGYAWQTEAEPGWDSAGAIGIDLLETPLDLIPGQDKDSDGIPDQYERDSTYYVNNVPPTQWDIDIDFVPDWRDASENPQKGMTAFKRLTLNLIPQNDAERYLTLAGYNIETGQYEPYDTFPPLPDDQRVLMSSGPFELQADSSVFLIFAIMLTYWKWHDVARPDTALAVIDQFAQEYYDMFWYLYTGVNEQVVSTPTLTSMQILPSLIHHESNIVFDLGERQAISIMLYDAAGRCVRNVFSGYCPAGRNKAKINAEGISPGTYFVVLRVNEKLITQKLVIVR